MSNILITSDIHLHDFRSHNILDDPLFRLNQFDLLAKRIIDICSTYNCDTIIIAGDFFHVASPRPYIFNRGVRFLQAISENRSVYIIPGQHDLDTRSGVDSEHTLLSACSLIPNVHFIHDAAISIGNKNFYFKGWTPEIDTSYISNGQYDVYIGHVTVESSKIGRYNTIIKSGQVFENNKFKLCFCGDIHKHQVVDNIVIPGCPIQGNFNDDDDNAVIVLNTDDLSWIRVPTRNDQFKFLTFKYEDNVDPNEQSEYTVIKQDVKTEFGVGSNQTAICSFNVEDMIKSSLDFELLKVHNKVSLLPGPADTIVDYDFIFSIGKVSIRNFRSIKSLDIDLSKYPGVMFIYGKNGSGKSALLNAINFCLSLTNSRTNNISHWSNEMSVSVTVNYGGLSHTIERGFKEKSYIDYYINGKKIESENQSATRVRILSNLKFLSLYDIMYHDQDRPRFLSSYNYSSRVDLVSRVLGISRVSALNEAAKELLASMQNNLRVIISDITSIESYIEFSEDNDFSEIGIDYESKISDIESELSSTRDIKTCFKSFKIKMQVLNSIIEEMNILSRSIKSVEIKDYDVTIAALEKNYKSIQNIIITMNKSLGDHSSIVNKYSEFLKDYENTRKSILNQIGSVKDRVCYVCHQAIGQDTIDYELKTLELKLYDLVKSHDDMSESAGISSTFIQLAKGRIDEAHAESESIRRLLIAEQAAKLEMLETSRIEKEITNLAKKRDTLKDELNSEELFFRNHKEDSIDQKIEDLVSKRSDLIVRLANKKKLESLRDSINTKKEKLKSEIAKRDIMVVDIANMENYIDMTSVKGSVIQSILTSFSDNLSTSMIRITTTKELSNGSLKPDFNVEMKIGSKFLPYDELSGGQKIVCDIFVIKSLIKTIGGVGTIIFDETFGELDSENLELAVENLRDISANNVIIVSHEANFPYYDTIVSVKSEESTSVYEIY